MPQSRESGRLKWTFTWNNYGPSAIQDLLDYARDSANKCDICFFQQETGESGTPHLQGFMQFSVKKRMQTIKNSLSNTIHFEPSRGTIEQNLEYCSKEDTRTGQFYEHWRDESLRPEPEEPLMVIDEEDLYPYQKELEEMYKTERLNAANLWKDKEGGGRQEQQRYNRLIHWVWERDGNVGKTSFAKYMCNKYPNSIKVDGSASDIKHGIVSLCMERDRFVRSRFPKLVIWNIVRSQQDDEGGARISWKAVEEVKDCFFFSGKYQSGMVTEIPPFILMFSNNPPDFSQLSEDRWKVHEVVKNSIGEYVFMD